MDQTKWTFPEAELIFFSGQLSWHETLVMLNSWRAVLLPGQPSRQPEVSGSRAPTQGTKSFSLKEKHGDQHIMYIV